MINFVFFYVDLNENDERERKRRKEIEALFDDSNDDRLLIFDLFFVPAQRKNEGKLAVDFDSCVHEPSKISALEVSNSLQREIIVHEKWTRKQVERTQRIENLILLKKVLTEKVQKKIALSQDTSQLEAQLDKTEDELIDFLLNNVLNSKK